MLGYSRAVRHCLPFLSFFFLLLLYTHISLRGSETLRTLGIRWVDLSSVLISGNLRKNWYYLFYFSVRNRELYKSNWQYHIQEFSQYNYSAIEFYLKKKVFSKHLLSSEFWHFIFHVQHWYKDWYNAILRYSLKNTMIFPSSLPLIPCLFLLSLCLSLLSFFFFTVIFKNFMV